MKIIEVRMKTKILILIACLLLSVNVGWGATYYVDSTQPDDTGAGTSWATAKKTIAAAKTVGDGVAGPHTLFIAPGTYSEAVNFTSAETNWANSTVQGTVSNASTSPATEGQVIISNTGYTYKVGLSTLTTGYITITGADFTHSNLYLSINGGTSTFNHVVFLGTAAPYLIDGYNSHAITFNNCKFLGDTGSIALNNNSTFIFNYCLFSGLPGKSLNGAVGQVASGGTATLNNCVMEGISGSKVLYAASGGTVNVYNSILHGSDAAYGAGYIAQQTGTGVINIDHSLLIPSWQQAYLSTYFLGTVGDTNNIKVAQPKYTKHRRTAIVVPCTDDAPDAEYAQSLSTELASRGLKGTWYVSPQYLTGSYLTTAQSLAAGTTMEIGLHGKTHTDLTTASAWTTTKAGSTINVDRAADTITLSPGGTVTGFKEKTGTAIKAELAALGATNSGVSSQDYNNGEMLADTSGAQSCATGYALPMLVDATGATGWLHEELAGGKALLESLIGGGYVVKVNSTPFGTNSEAIASATQGVGLQSGRPGFYSGTLSSWRLNNIDLFKVSYIGSTNFIGASDDETRRIVRAIAEGLLQDGQIIFLLAHNTSEATIAQWKVVLDTLAEYSDITVTSNSGAVDLIKATETDDSANHSGVTGRYYVKTWTDLSDYRLRPNSPANRTGVAIAGIHDQAGCSTFDNKSCYTTTPNIGAYSTAPSGGGSFPWGFGFP
jgi:hypothetical protein